MLESRRIAYLDGLRGVAILLVIGFHAFSRWPDLVPYGGTYAGFPIFQYGWLGVQLFFLISGFVILMTLERCRSGPEFLIRRWLRLFPAMAICTALIVLTAPVFSERPAGPPTLSGAIAGLLFVEPRWIAHIAGEQVRSLEGAFWSLYVEFKFYVIAALIYFLVSRRYFSLLVFGLFAISAGAQWLDAMVHWRATRFVSSIAHHLSLEHFAYFAAGAEFYLFVSRGTRYHWLIGLAMALLATVQVRSDAPSQAAAAVVVLLFAMAVRVSSIQWVLARPVWVFFGFISYPLYLLHENMLIASVIKLRDVPLPGFLLPMPVVAAISLLAWLVAVHGEGRLRTVLQRTRKSRGAVPG